MANPLNYGDFINPGVIDELINDQKRYAKEAIKSMGSIEDAVEALMNKTNALGHARAQEKQEIIRLARKVDELAREYKEETKSKERSEAAIINLREEKKKLNRLYKLEIQQAKSAKGSYDRLSATYRINKIRLNAMSDAQRFGTKAGKELEKQTIRIHKEMDRLQQRTGRYVHQIGNYEKGVKGLVRQIKFLAAAYLSLEGARRFVDVVFNQTKQLASLDTAYKQVLKSQTEVDRAMEFTSNIAEAYGSNILTLRKSYLRFRAATASSSLTLEQQEGIFSSVAKSAAALGLETERVDRAYNALEQIMSKGVVSSEELRQQLGDALPGSLEIMAKALGVTTLELNKMLAQGEVLSDVALPKFAAELEKTYGIENVTRIDNAVTAQGRFETAITRLVQRLEASNAIEDFFIVLTNSINFISKNIGAIYNLAKGVALVTTAYVTWKTAVLASNVALSLEVPLIARAIKQRGAYATAVTLGTRAVKAFNAALASNPIALVTTLLATATTAYLAFNRQAKEYLNVTRAAEVEIRKELTVTRELFSEVRNLQNSTDDRRKALEKLQEMYPDILGNLDAEKSTIEDLTTAEQNLTATIKNRIVEQQRGLKLGELYTDLAEAEQRLNELRDGSPLTIGEVGTGVASGRFGRVGAIERLESRLIGLQKQIDRTNESFDRLLVDAPGGGSSGGFRTPPKARGGVSGSGAKGDPSKPIEAFLQAQEDGLEKEIALEKLRFERKINEFEGYADVQQALEDQLQRNIQKIVKKYQDKEDNELAAKLKAKEKENDILFKAELSAFDDQQKLQAQELELIEASEKEKTRLRLKLEQDRIRKILALNEKFGKTLTDQQKQIFLNSIDILQAEIDKLDKDKGVKDIYDLVGLKLSDDQKASIDEAITFARDQISGIFELQAELAQQEVDRTNQAVSSAERLLHAEIDNRNAGYAHRVSTATKELQLAKQNQREALAEQRRAQRAQVQLNGLLQASNLITASSKIMSQWGWPLGAVFSGLMFGAFASAQSKAIELTKEKRDKGGVDVVGGGLHSTGDDTYMGYSVNGNPVFAERGEVHITIPRKQVLKTGIKKLEDWGNAMIRGTMEEDFISKNSTLTPTLLMMNNTNTTDMTETNSILRRIDKKTDEKVDYVNGVKVVTRGSSTLRYG